MATRSTTQASVVTVRLLEFPLDAFILSRHLSSPILVFVSLDFPLTRSFFRAIFLSRSWFLCIASCPPGKRPANPLHHLFTAHVAAQRFVTRHPKDIGIVAKAEVIEDCAAPCDFYINSVDEPEPAKREVELVKESEDLEDCAAPCDFYVRSEVSTFRLFHTQWHFVSNVLRTP